MKRLLTALLLSFFALTLSGQTLQLNVTDQVSEDARTILTQRFIQMLDAVDLKVGEEGPVLEVSVKEVSREDAPGAVAQVAVQLEVTAACKGVSEVFPLKGVGSDVDDATLRAVKMLLPRSKTAQSFVQCLKQSL